MWVASIACRSRRGRGARGLVLLVVLSALAPVCLTVYVSPALATPPGITGLASPTHPDSTSWYANNSPSFVWNPATASTAAITGYSCVLDHSATTVPVLTGSDSAKAFVVPALAFSGARTDYTTGSYPRSVAVGDFNGDGEADLAVADYSDSTVSVLLGNGDGGFAAKTDYATGTGPYVGRRRRLQRRRQARPGGGRRHSQTPSACCSATATAPSRPRSTTRPAQAPTRWRWATSTATASPTWRRPTDGGNTVSVLLGNGDGTFAAKADYATGAGPRSVAVGDFNGDGKLDLATANGMANSVSVLLGNGDGTFQAKVDLRDRPATAAVLGRRRRLQRRRQARPGDGERQTPTRSACCSATATAAFAAKVDYATGDDPRSVAVGDFNGDGKPDLVTANGSDQHRQRAARQRRRRLCRQADYATGSYPCLVAVSDLNGDGKVDLAVADQGARTVSVLLNVASTSAGFTALPDGVWYFHVRAVDSAGTGGPTATCTVRIDSTPPSGTMLLNNGAASTSSATVTADSSVTGAIEMRFASSNGGTLVYGAWRPYAATATVTLYAPNGTKRVYAYYRDAAGNVFVTSDTIFLSTG